ncbi:hypothetical protein PM082_019533 [Marasmius tenuissimus]|nr:hypothetical protein PM082_019533 [Marasmius tenuissimus]
MNVLTLGGSKNIGYYSSIRLLDAGSTVTFLLRNASCFDSDKKIQKYVTLGKAFLFKGDGLVQDDVRKAWEAAEKNGKKPVDLLLFTVGGVPSFELTKGLVVKPYNLVTQCFLNVLTTIPPNSPRPKIVAISSTGVTKSSFASVPAPIKLLYSSMKSIHYDKQGVERVAHHCAGWNWNDAEVGSPVLSANWRTQEGLPEAGTLRDVLLVRPGILTDGKCMADEEGIEGKPPYRASEEDIRGWTVSRQDVAHFIADAVLNRWEEYRNKSVTIVY